MYSLNGASDMCVGILLGATGNLCPECCRPNSTATPVQSQNINTFYVPAWHSRACKRQRGPRFWLCAPDAHMA